jgi:hypothetical protein
VFQQDFGQKFGVSTELAEISGLFEGLSQVANENALAMRVQGFY